MYGTHPPWISFHDFFHFHMNTIKVKAHGPGFDTHNGNHAGGEGCGHKIGRGEPFAFSIVINRGIGFEMVAGAEVCTGSAKAAFINDSRSHTFLPKFTFEPYISIYVKKFILIITLFSIGSGVWAQETTATTPTKQERKKTERTRRGSLNRQQEEEGVLNFRNQTAFGVQLRTNGYGAFLEIGRSRSPRFTNLYLLEITEIKHPKEEKISNGTIFSNAFVFGKINNFYQVKLGFGQQYVFGQKGNKNGVAVLGIVHGGLSLGLLKPYYIQVQETQAGAKDVKYDSRDSAVFLDLSRTIGGSGFTKGWNELKMRPGAFVKTALRFDFGRFNETIQALEIGMSVDAYASKIPQLVYVNPQQFFFQGHIAIVFGHRK